MARFDEAKSWIALIGGIIVAALGVFPLLERFGVMQAFIPEFINNLLPTLSVWVLVAGGFLLLVDAFAEYDTIRTVSVIVSILLVAIGVVELLFNFGVIGFHVPFMGGLLAAILLTIEGFFLIIAAFAVE